VGDHSITDRAASFLPGALRGMRVLWGGQLRRISENSLTTIYTDPADGVLSAAGQAGGAYRADLSLGRLMVRNGASVEIRDADQARPSQRGVLQASEIALASHARLTHPPATVKAEFGLELNISGGASIDPTSVIEADGRG
jgi:hypothetical protein